MTAQEILATARLMAKEKHPYFRAAIDALVPRQAPGFGTVGVTERGIMLWDPEKCVQWGAKKLAAILVHEIGHLLRDHPGRQKAMAADQRLFNMAGDLAINPDVLAAGWELPEDGMFPKDFGWEDGLAAEEYYARLRDMQQEESKDEGESNEKRPGDDGGDENQGGQGGSDGGEEGGEGRVGSGNDPGDRESESGRIGDDDKNSQGTSDKSSGDSDGSDSGGTKDSGGGRGDQADDQPKPQPKVGGGWCGSCAGNPLPGEPEDESEGRSEADLNRVRKETAEAVREAASKGRGTVPGGWARWAEDFSKPPKIPWQQKLARFARAAVSYGAGARDFTYKRPSRRQAALGYGVGRPVLPSMHAPQPTAVVAVDTSGSMGTAQLESALREARGVLLACGTRVTFIACDAEVHAVKEIRHWREMPALLKGGGGTDMRPIFGQISKMRKKPDAVIVVTDGYVGDVGPQPNGYKVIWASVGVEEPFAPWGDFVHVESQEEQ